MTISHVETLAKVLRPPASPPQSFHHRPHVQTTCEVTRQNGRRGAVAKIRRDDPIGPCRTQNCASGVAAPAAARFAGAAGLEADRTGANCQLDGGRMPHPLPLSRRSPRRPQSLPRRSISARTCFPSKRNGPLLLLLHKVNPCQSTARQLSNGTQRWLE